MSKTIALDQFPRHVEILLRATGEGRESVVFAHNGKPVAAVVTMEEYFQLHPEAKRLERTETNSSYDLPVAVLEAYHRLLDKKFSEGLTPEEEAELTRLDRQLDAVELATPLVQSVLGEAANRHERWIHTLNDVITQLHALQELG